MTEHEEYVRDVLARAASTLWDDHPLLSAFVSAVADDVIGWAREKDECLHYDAIPRRKFRGELVCGSCSWVFGYWTRPQTFRELVQAEIPDATDAFADYVLWEHTLFPISCRPQDLVPDIIRFQGELVARSTHLGALPPGFDRFER